MLGFASRALRLVMRLFSRFTRFKLIPAARDFLFGAALRCLSLLTRARAFALLLWIAAALAVRRFL